MNITSRSMSSLSSSSSSSSENSDPDDQDESSSSSNDLDIVEQQLSIMEGTFKWQGGQNKKGRKSVYNTLSANRKMVNGVIHGVNKEFVQSEDEDALDADGKS